MPTDPLSVLCVQLMRELLAIAKFLCILATDRQTNRWTAPMHEAALAVATGG